MPTDGQLLAHASAAPFDLSPDAAALIRERGGSLYIWSDADGYPHADTARPWRYVEFAESPWNDITACVDRRILAPQRWEIVTRSWRTRTSLETRYNGIEPGSPLGRCHFVPEPDELAVLPTGPLAHVRRFLIWRVPWGVYYFVALGVAPLVGLSTHSVKIAGWLFLGLILLTALFLPPLLARRRRHTSPE